MAQDGCMPQEAVTAENIGLRSWQDFTDPEVREFVGRVAAHVAHANVQGAMPESFSTRTAVPPNGIEAALAYLGNRGWGVQCFGWGSAGLNMYFC
jgi:hypothetical protein